MAAKCQISSTKAKLDEISLAWYSFSDLDGSFVVSFGSFFTLRDLLQSLKMNELRLRYTLLIGMVINFG
jgi:hypothetical protein